MPILTSSRPGDFVGRGTQSAEAVAEPVASPGSPCSLLVWLLLLQRWLREAPAVSYRCSVMMGDRSVCGEISGLVVPISRVVVHPQFSTRGTVKYDLALLRLFYPVNFTGVIQPICIPEKTFQVEAGTRCWVTGWGKQQEFGGPCVSVFLWEMDQYIIYYEECNGMIQKAMPADKDVVLEGMLCGYNSIGNDSRQLSSWGDSGDPLVCQYNTTWVQIGIVSWGVSCGCKISPGVFTDTAFYTKWLVAVVNQATSLYPVVLLILLVCLVLPLGILATL
ncbi:serine protease 42-like [Delphinus delphis]|uniref:serine protease 42-like n=1 Tax=Delphinus delphis TaxID=9728 RepID=UPI0037509685